jgi:hypothetical protein
MSLPSTQRNILQGLAKLKHDKWGFVIYRCTYRDDQAWNRFKQIVHTRTQDDMADSDAPEAADSLEWTFVDDRVTLDGASKDQLRARFKQWAAGAIVAENLRAEQNQTFGVPRYRYFVQVDEQALQSVLSAPALDPSRKGFVNFVDSQWEPSSEELPGEHGDEDEDEGEGDDDENVDDESYDPIEGCTEENVGWMKIAAMMIDASFYDISSGFAYGAWHVYYKRPPAMVLY